MTLCNAGGEGRMTGGGGAPGTLPLVPPDRPADGTRTPKGNNVHLGAAFFLISSTEFIKFQFYGHLTQFALKQFFFNIVV